MAAYLLPVLTQMQNRILILSMFAQEILQVLTISTHFATVFPIAEVQQEKFIVQNCQRKGNFVNSALKDIIQLTRRRIPIQKINPRKIKKGKKGTLKKRRFIEMS